MAVAQGAPPIRLPPPQPAALSDDAPTSLRIPPAAPPRVLMLWAGRRPGPWTGRALVDDGAALLVAHPHGARGAWRPPGGAVLRYPRPADDPEGFIDWLSRTCRQSGIDAVVPLDEHIVALTCAHAERLGDTRFIGPTAAQYRALCDKSVLPTTCALAGVAHPATAVVGPHGATGPLPPLPSVVKPARETEITHDTVPAAVVVTTAGERDAAVAAVIAGGGSAVVQQRLTGRQWGVYCTVTADRTVGVVARVLTTSPRPAGTPSRLRVDDAHPGILEVGARLLDSVGYRGIANLDCIEVDGRVHVLDANLRPAASAGLPGRAGVDLAPVAVAAALGLPARETHVRTSPPFTYVSLEGELEVLRSGPGLRARLTLLARLVRDALAADVFLDPPPRDVAWLGGRLLRALRRR